MHSALRRLSSNWMPKLTNGDPVSTVSRVPGPVPALCLKLLSWDSRMAAKDATDIWRMLAVCDAAGITPGDWPDVATTRDALQALRRFASIGSISLRQVTPDRTTQTRIRAIASRVSGIG